MVKLKARWSGYSHVKRVKNFKGSANTFWHGDFIDRQSRYTNKEVYAPFGFNVLFSSGSEVTPACQNKLSNYCYFPLSVECHASLRELIFVLSVMGGADEDTCKPFFFYQF